MDLLDIDRLRLALSVLKEFRQCYEITPSPHHVFQMFRMICPSQVKVVLITQSPYPGVCPATGVRYAFGPAFMPNPRCATTPGTLRRFTAELCRDLGMKRLTVPPIRLLNDWVDQGVMLLNASLTLGTGGCPRHLEDHSVLWKEIMCNLVHNLSCHYRPVFVLIGTDAWHLEQSIVASSPILKVSHPDAQSWMGSAVFSRVSTVMIKRGDAPIQWCRF